LAPVATSPAIRKGKAIEDGIEQDRSSGIAHGNQQNGGSNSGFLLKNFPLRPR
jgi:hypothetical protein